MNPEEYQASKPLFWDFFNGLLGCSLQMATRRGLHLVTEEFAKSGHVHLLDRSARSYQLPLGAAPGERPFGFGDSEKPHDVAN